MVQGGIWRVKTQSDSSPQPVPFTPGKLYVIGYSIDEKVDSTAKKVRASGAVHEMINKAGRPEGEDAK